VGVIVWVEDSMLVGNYLKYTMNRRINKISYKKPAACNNTVLKLGKHRLINKTAVSNLVHHLSAK
jgi:hypothetical protein